MFGSFGTVSRKAALCLGAIVALGIHAPAGAQGDLLVAPTRIVMQGGGGTEVILNNIGERAATYRITIELRRMTPAGELVEVDPAQATDKERAALAMVRYAPRRIMLPPGQPQSVRISARPDTALPDGEYRVHMSFRAIPDPVAPPASVATAAPAGNAPIPPEPTATGLSIKLTPIYGITIPVIVRKGALDAAATLSAPQVIRDRAASYLKLEMGHTGARSVYGELRITLRGGGEPIFLARGVAIYAELASRTLTMPLSPDQTARLHGPLHFEYREMPEAGGKLIAALDASLS